MWAWAARIRALISHADDSVSGGESRVARWWSAPTSLRPMAIVAALFVTYQAVVLLAYPGLPWHMFGAAPRTEFRLEAIGTSADGHQYKIPIHDEIFTHHRGLTKTAAFEEAAWLMQGPGKGDMNRKRELALYFQERLARWDIQIVQVELRIRRTHTTKGDTWYDPVAKFELPPPPPRRPPE